MPRSTKVVVDPRAGGERDGRAVVKQRAIFHRGDLHVHRLVVPSDAFFRVDLPLAVPLVEQPLARFDELDEFVVVEGVEEFDDIFDQGVSFTAGMRGGGATKAAAAFVTSGFVCGPASLRCLNPAKYESPHRTKKVTARRQPPGKRTRVFRDSETRAPGHPPPAK